MKKLAILFLSLAFTGGVAMACPHDDGPKADNNTPKVAEKDKAKADDKKPAEKPKADADKSKTAKPEKQPEKKPEKVSSK